MARDYPGRAEWEDEMRAATRVPTWEIFDKSDGTVCPPGLLLSLGDGRAVEGTIEMIARELFNARQYNNPYGPPNWDEQPVAIKAVFLKRAVEFRDRLIQQAQEARDA